MAFSDRLDVTLTLTVGETTHTIPGGNVKAFELDLASFGFTAAVEFVVIDDADQGGEEGDQLITSFAGQDLIEVSLSVKPELPDPESETPITPVAVTGLVTRKSVEEVFDRTPDRVVVYRRYRVELADPARVLWSQHFPCDLYAPTEEGHGVTMQATLDAHKGDKITLAYDWAALTAEVPMIFLHLRPEDRSSFYDFVAWYVDTRAGFLAYDYATKGYKLSGAKDATATAKELFGDDVASLRAVFPEVARHKPNVLNSYTESAATKPIENAQAVDGVRQDHLIRTPIAQHVDDRVTRETSRLVLRQSELEIAFARWPTIAFGPGSAIEFANTNLWPADALQVGPTWRVFHHRIAATIRDPRLEVDRDLGAGTFDIDVAARLEQQAETFSRLPRYVDPTYPGHVEGKVVSEQGADTELTYQFYTDQSTSLDQYEVKVPLFADQVVTAPYYPHQGSGKMYVPLHKNARVLIAFGFEHATIVHLLDWREGVRMAMDAQGEQLFFGKSATAGTMVNHAYDDDKPVFKVARAHDKDKATIEIKEGVLTIQVKEDA